MKWAGLVYGVGALATFVYPVVDAEDVRRAAVLGAFWPFTLAAIIYPPDD